MKTQQGFTLIEIMIALLVIAIALGAVINTVGTSVAYGSLLKEKIISGWVAQNYINEMVIHREWPEPGMQTEQIKMAGKQWYINNHITQTPDETIRRIDLTVFSDRNRENKVSVMTAYINQLFRADQN